ncbi:MAG: hypothetical protein JXQ83_06795 [Candidatus Glassbacteria bacterium]|nr:hypothetical protein [Candidatus Glassbacteria bacterium]
MKKKTFYTLVFSLAAAGLCSIFTAESAYAVPAFARKYRLSCKTCHQPIPRLKPYGDEFAGNGFVLTDQEAPRYFVETGDDELSLIRDFPIAVRLEGFINYNDVAGKRSDFNTPYLLKLLSGGALTKNIAYYFYFYMDERGEVAGVEDAYVMFNNLLGVDLDIYAGQFQVSDPLFKRELRLTLEDYQAYKSTPGRSGINLTYDRGIMVTYGLPSGTDLIFEVVNGNGLSEADEDKNFDSDRYKNFMGRISQDVGKYLRLGVFGYTGREKSAGRLNQAWLAGPDLTVSINEKFELNLQYVERRDTNPYFLSSGYRDLKTRGALGEMVIAPRGSDGKVYLVGLFNWTDSDDNSEDFKSLTGHLSYLLRRNIRLVGEVTHNWANDTNRLGVGFVSAF